MTPVTATLVAELIVVLAIIIGAAIIINGHAIGAVALAWVS